MSLGAFSVLARLAERRGEIVRWFDDDIVSPRRSFRLSLIMFRQSAKSSSSFAKTVLVEEIS